LDDKKTAEFFIYKFIIFISIII